jgi:hypothetical protein
MLNVTELVRVESKRNVLRRVREEIMEERAADAASNDFLKGIQAALKIVDHAIEQVGKIEE